LNVLVSECFFGDLIEHLIAARNLLHRGFEQKESHGRRIHPAGNPHPLTGSWGGRMFCMYSIEMRADLCDGAYTMLSTDNGHTWSEPEFHEAEIARPDGILRRFPGGIAPAIPW
jgi:hypothetical protein